MQINLVKFYKYLEWKWAVKSLAVSVFKSTGWKKVLKYDTALVICAHFQTPDFESLAFAT